MILNTLDKAIFAVLLLTFFQMPLLATDYLQFINGYYLSTKAQVDAYTENAVAHEYADARAMIDDFRKNPNPAVRQDAEQKAQTLREFADLTRALDILKHGNLFQKAMYMLSPSRWDVLREVMTNFKPGIPLDPFSLGYSALGALVLGGMVMWPARRMAGRRERRHR